MKNGLPTSDTRSAAREETQFTPLTGNQFFFKCHPDIPCFNECCAKLRLVLTPWDILRMKQRLGQSSGDFLHDYTETAASRHNRFPLVQLKMRSEARQRCPFLTSEGCRIYEDRPVSCRLYPVGRASTHVSSPQSAEFFLVQEPHCMGLQQNRPWTLSEWLEHEGVTPYDEANREWLDIVTSSRSLGDRATTQAKLQVFFMVSYDLDRFRQYLFESRFFRLFEVKEELRDRLNQDDETLLEFGIGWLRFSLFGETSSQFRILPPAGSG